MSNSTNIITKTRAKTLYMVQLAIFIAIELIFCFTPLGSIPISVGIVATLAHIPAIIAALILGYKAALILGGVMGFSSLIIWTFIPPNALVAFAFSPFAPNGNFMSLIISVLPRMLFPIVAFLIYSLLKDKVNTVFGAVVASISGSFVHSLLVLSLIYFTFKGNAYVGGNYTNFIVAWGGVNAILEIAAAGIIGGAVIVPLLKLNKNKN